MEIEEDEGEYKYIYCYYYYYCLDDEGVAAMDDEVGDYLVVEKKEGVEVELTQQCDQEK